MSENRIDLTITQEQVDKVLAALKTIEEAIPGLIELTPEQRQAMPRYSDKDLGFILKALAIAEQHPEILPPSFKLEEMRHDVDALQKLDIIIHALTRVAGIYSDSRYTTASESQGHGRTIYQFVKTQQPDRRSRRRPRRPRQAIRPQTRQAGQARRGMKPMPLR